MSMQTGFEQYAEMLLEEILIKNPEGLKKYLAGTPVENLLAPQNSNLFGSVVGVIMERVQRKEKS
ncbi:MAG: hypothetical protein VST70_04560 [Nitrospirota bacterium]|nr:hypothetical protein [Nitrospirota bacterium]